MNENENQETLRESEQEIAISKDFLKMGLEQYVEKIVTKEIGRVYILSDDEIEEEAVLISPEEYWHLKKSLREFNRCKKLMQMSTEGMFEVIQKDLQTLKDDMNILKDVR